MFVLWCYLFGHKMVEFHAKEINEQGYFAGYNVELKACRRCGKPNPNYEGISKEDIPK